jgi:hypothetical protein
VPSYDVLRVGGRLVRECLESSKVGTSGTGAFKFDLGDAFGFSAVPCPGYSFQRLCGDVPACSLTTTANLLTGTITAAEGIVYAVFSVEPAPVPFPAGSD